MTSSASDAAMARGRRSQSSKIFGRHEELTDARTHVLLAADDPSRLSLPPLWAGKAVRQGNHALLGVVRAAVGNHDLRDPHRVSDHWSSSTTIRPRPAPRCSSAPCRSCRRPTDASPKSMSARADRSPRARRSSGSTATRQQAALETARRKIIEVEAAMIVAQADIQKAEGQLREAKGNAPAGPGRTGHQAGIAPAQPGHRSASRHREARGSRGRHPGRGCCRKRGKAGGRNRGVSGVLPAEKASAEARWLRPRRISTRPSSAPA